MSRKFQSTKGVLSNICLCIAYLAIQSQWQNFIEEIMKTYSDSLEAVTTAFIILKDIVQEVMNEDIVIDRNLKKKLMIELEGDGAKILEYLNMWSKNFNDGKIGEGTPIISKWKFSGYVFF